jgi:DNA adenine methylase
LGQYDELARYAEEIKGKMIISVNDIPEMRKAFAGLKMKTVGINYVGGAGKGKNKSDLIITNW